MMMRELPWRDPGQVFLTLADAPGFAFLDSAANDDPRAKVSYIGLDPVAILRLDPLVDDPYARLGAWLEEMRPADHAPPVSWPFAFAGGAVGWLGYDLGCHAAGVQSRFAPMPGLPGGWFGLYDTLLAFDHGQKRLFALAGDRNAGDAPARLADFTARLAEPLPPMPPVARPDWRAELPPAQYKARIEALRTYIAAGDVYQANFTTRFSAPRAAAFQPAAYYAALRRRSPAPFAAYLDGGDGVVLCCTSPERFLRLVPDGLVETRPIKGTAPRAADQAADAAFAAQLLASPKERAENLMITDLLRNDLGQVCETGSIDVPQLLAVESYAQAHHLVSAVTGRLRAGLGPTDLLRATFPGGSITGAPKRRAMQIIDALESAPRGAYCGMLGWIGHDGAMDSAIIIRTLVATRERLYAQAGGGITWDSDPAAEYAEMRLKLEKLLEGCDG